MAMVLGPSSHSPNDDDDRNIPTATLVFHSIATPSLSRRLPPPCWTPEETAALIDAYREKWYSLSRGNLRASHWQEVADEVACRCPVSLSKTAVQCRHKMEKLRKRYRGEIQRAATCGGVRRSSWVHFQNMDSMEKGPNNPSPSSFSSGEEEDYRKNSIKRINELYHHSNIRKDIFSNQGAFVNGTPWSRIKTPSRVTPAPPAATKVYGNIDQTVGQNPNNPNPRFTTTVTNGYGAASNKVLRNGFVGRGEKRNRVGGVDEVVAAIQAVGEGFMRIEKVKMEMTLQIEELRMEMELMRTESQQRFVEAFAKAIYESSKKARRK